MKKLINDPFDMVEEMVDGFLSANDDIVRRVGRRSIARVASPIAGKVGIVVGGGSGTSPSLRSSRASRSEARADTLQESEAEHRRRPEVRVRAPGAPCGSVWRAWRLLEST